MPGSSPGQDYTDASFTFSFAPFTVGTQTASLVINDDVVDELTETLTYGCIETTASVLAGPIVQETLTIIDDDTATLCVIATAYGEGAGSPNLVEVILSTPSDRAVTVDFTVESGTALDGVDATLINGTLSWPMLSSGTRTASIAVFDDFLVEANETLLVKIANATGGPTISGPCSSAVATIVENDYLVCGDGVRYAAEEWDDGNLFDGDGCSSTCVIEPNAQCVVVIGSASLCRVLRFSPTTVQESDIFTPDQDVIITVEIAGDTWDPAIGTNATISAGLLDAFSGSLATAFGFNSIVSPTLSHTNVTRLNDTHLQVVIGTLRFYAIDTDEVVTVSELPAIAFGSGMVFNLTAGSSFTITDTGLTVQLQGSSLACDGPGSSFAAMGAYSNITLEVYGSTFNAASWATAAQAFAFYDSLEITGNSEFTCLAAHMLGGDRPDKLVHPDSFTVESHKVVITFEKRLPAYLKQLAAARVVSLPAGAVSANTPATISVYCGLAWT